MPFRIFRTLPGVFVKEISLSTRSINGVETSIAALIGWSPAGIPKPSQPRNGVLGQPNPLRGVGVGPT